MTPLPFVGSDEELVDALGKGHPGAAKAFYDRYADLVDRILWRTLGADDRIPELIQEVFARAIAGATRLRDPSRLAAWVATAAVTIARGHLRRRARRRLLARLLIGRRFDVEAPARAADSLGRTMYAFYAILETLPADERIVLALRVVDAMPLAEVAEVCRVSLPRLKRRLRRAEARFVTAARESVALGPWLDRGSRWSLPILG